MGTGYQSHRAGGSKARCGVGKCRTSTTISIPLFERIRARAKENYASISEEIAKTLGAAYPAESDRYGQLPLPRGSQALARKRGAE